MRGQKKGTYCVGRLGIMPKYKNKIEKEPETLNDIIEGIITALIFNEIGVVKNASVPKEDNAPNGL